MKLSVIITIILFGQFHLKSSVVINEIYPAPNTDEQEWVELYNNSGQMQIITGLELNDATGSKALPDIEISGGQYCLIAADTNLLRELYELPGNILLVESALPSLNNGGDELALYSGGELIDTVFYDGTTKGKSIERINPDEMFMGDNAGLCENPGGSTPGYLNSISVPAADAVAKELLLIDETLEFTVENTGSKKIDELLIRIILDKSPDGAGPEVLILHEENTGLGPASEYSSNISLVSHIETGDISGNFTASLVVNNPLDARPDNDTLTKKFFFSGGDIRPLINEIMFAPATGNAEYIEIYNAGEGSINYSGWKIADEAARGSSKEAELPEIIQKPGEYLVIAYDEIIFERFSPGIDSAVVIFPANFPSLNNSGDLLLLIDPGGNIADSVIYSPDWHSSALVNTKDISLEKINPEMANDRFAWSSCADASGGTPGWKNSLAREILDQGGLAAEPNPFSPFSAGSDNFTVISYELPYKQAYLTIRLFNPDGVKITDIVNNRYTASTGNITWDGKNTEGFNLAPGPYVLLLEATDTGSGAVHSDKILLVIGK
jgi:hypothetical protein